MNKRNILKAAGALLCAGLGMGVMTSHAQGQPFPSRPLALVVPFAPGNSADILARLIAQKLSVSMGQPVVVENRPGAGGVAAINLVASAAPDGHTLLMIGTGAAISQSLFKPQPYDLVKRLAPVANLTETQVLILVGKNSRMNTLSDFIREAKTRKGGLNVGVSLLGTTQHLTAELFKLNANVDFTIVPFKTAAAAAMGLTAGDIDAVFELMPPVMGQLQGGSLKALAIGGSKRSELVPTVPTAGESGIPNFDVTSWGMIVAPAGTPDAVVQRLNQDIQRALADTDVTKRFKELGMGTLGGTPQQARDLMNSEITKWHGVIDKAKISLQ